MKCNIKMIVACLTIFVKLHISGCIRTDLTILIATIIVPFWHFCDFSTFVVTMCVEIWHF